MSVLIGIALKSVLLAGLTLGLLKLMKHRSAAERSWVAHMGLLALVIMALAPLVLPSSLSVEAPSPFSSGPALETPAPAAIAAPSSNSDANIAATHINPPAVAPAKASPSRPSISATAAASALYAVPAAILLLITLLAVVRLFALRARAEVLVDGHWLTALARAQRRMGFKHGTALLTSNTLASPISWGLVRPVILLSSRAVEALDEAEAIIAHELAHVARMDQVKLLLARVATALFWFNPLVWLLAREAHQLREETADDAVLAANIPDTDYAQLLVGVARHECPGLLLGAHGVAPSKSSLARRVARVLDGKSVRGPVARGFATGVFVGAIMVAAPLAALTLTPAGKSDGTNSGAESSGRFPSPMALSPTPTDLPHIIAKGVSTSVASAVAAIGQSPDAGDFRATAPSGATVSRVNGTMVATGANGSTVTQRNGTTVATSPSGANVTIYPPDRSGRRKVVAVGANGATSVVYTDADVPPSTVIGNWTGHAREKSAVDRAIEMKAVGVTPEYVASIKSVLPQLHLTSEDLVQLKGVGVTPEFIQELAREGYRNVDADDISGAYAVGVRPDYMRGMAAAGYPRLSLDQLTQLKAVGVTPNEPNASGVPVSRTSTWIELVQAKTLGLSPEEIRASRDDP